MLIQLPNGNWVNPTSVLSVDVRGVSAVHVTMSTTHVQGNYVEVVKSENPQETCLQIATEVNETLGRERYANRLQ